MKIKSLTMQNFAKYTEASVSFDENITYLIGGNGSGKSTAGVTAIHAVFCGIAEKGKTALIGERFRFIGPASASANIGLVLHDEKLGVDITVRRKITKGGNELSFDAPEGYPVSPQWLEDLFNVFLIAPKRFIELSSKDQALALGIDPSDFDRQLKAEKEAFTLINRDLKNMGSILPVEKTDRVDISELNKQKDELVKFNTDQHDLKEDLNRSEKAIETLEDEAKIITRQIDELELKRKSILNRIDAGKEYIREAKKPQEPKPLEEINQKINNATETNEKAFKYEQYLEKVKSHKKIIADLESNKTKQAKIEKERKEYIKKQDLPFDNLEITEEGELLLSGKPIKEPYFSTGELLKIVPVLMSSKNPDLKYVFIQDFNLLDEDKQAEVEETLTSQGMQLVIELVGSKKIENKNSILLKDCKIVESYTEQKNGKLLI